MKHHLYAQGDDWWTFDEKADWWWLYVTEQPKKEHVMIWKYWAMQETWGWGCLGSLSVGVAWVAWGNFQN